MNLKDILNNCGSEPNLVKAVEDKLKLLASENPDFVYNPEGKGKCSYNGRARNDADTEDLTFIGPECNGCIFGQAFQLLGWDDELEKSSRLAISELMQSFCKRMIAPFNWALVQDAQDRGKTWAEAIKVLA